MRTIKCYGGLFHGQIQEVSDGPPRGLDYLEHQFAGVPSSRIAPLGPIREETYCLTGRMEKMDNGRMAEVAVWSPEGGESEPTKRQKKTRSEDGN